MDHAQASSNPHLWQAEAGMLHVHQQKGTPWTPKNDTAWACRKSAPASSLAQTHPESPSRLPGGKEQLTLLKIWRDAVAKTTRDRGRLHVRGVCLLTSVARKISGPPKRAATLLGRLLPFSTKGTNRQTLVCNWSLTPRP